ncbi:MAG: ABC-2 transporter permease [Lachnospiraceae bacterium]
MKGLLVKDFKLMMVQKIFFIMITAIAIGMIVFTDDVTFPMGFLTLVISLFALSTISYDEYDNGNAFLFSLPITRTGYVAEKYCLGLLLGCGSWLFATLLSVLAAVTKRSIEITELVMGSFLILSMVLIMQALMFPFQLKYGSEKGRIAIFGLAGAVSVIGVIIVKGTEFLFHIDLPGMVESLPVVRMGILIAITFAIGVVLFLISMKVSAVIMNRKEL